MLQYLKIKEARMLYPYVQKGYYSNIYGNAILRRRPAGWPKATLTETKSDALFMQYLPFFSAAPSSPNL